MQNLPQNLVGNSHLHGMSFAMGDISSQLFQPQVHPAMQIGPGIHGMGGEDPNLLQYGSFSHHLLEDQNMTAYARLDFPDVNYYIHTFAVKLGRDLAAAKSIRRREAAAGKQQEPQTPTHKNRERRSPTALESERGGMLRYKDDTDSDEHEKKRTRHRTKSTGSVSVHRSRRSTQSPASQRRHVLSLMDQGRPPPNSTPLLPICGPESHLKSISRVHAKIEFNPQNELWELKIRG